MEERRNSRIPRSGIPPLPSAAASNTAVKPLTERNGNSCTVASTGGAKRRAPGLDAIPEAKRTARPTRSAPAPPAGAAPAVSSGQAASFQSEGHGRSQPGPAPGDETFDDINARTGLSEADILAKKMAFRKGLRPEKKLEEMAPMIKELRAVGWHLLSSRDKLSMDAEQWRMHSEEVEAEYHEEKAAWAKKQDEIEAQMKDFKGMLEMAETNTARLTEDIKAAEGMISEKTGSLNSLQQQLDSTRSDLDKANRTISDTDAKIREMEDVIRQSQAYSTTLQTYNTTLQNDLKEEKSKRDEAARERDLLQGKVAELGGQAKSLEQQLSYEREQVGKLREEREVMSHDLAVLRADLDNTRGERERLLADNTRLKSEYDRIKSAGGKSLETLEALTHDKATMEVQLSTQQKLLADMRHELALSKENQAMAESMAGSRSTQVGELQAQVSQLQSALSDAERRVLEGEMVRRKLHNIIQELKGNIRVFCRVRPISASEQSSTDHDSMPAVEFPPVTDVLGAGIVLQAPVRNNAMDTLIAPTKHTFNFDKVFAPTSGQETVFEEISDLVQSALDGHKVCIFAYGQTGSGKTYTMVGTPQAPGMIPKSMHQVFDTSRKLGAQGWSFRMSASMLEIYNEEYKDLLSKSKRDDKKHQVVHNGDGSTNVTDLTSIDVSTPEKVDMLLSEAMEKRSVGCTQLNEHSSRSHMVFTLRIDGSNSNTGQTIAGVLNLIDLAGSERVKESGATGQQLKEAQAINKSLSSLGDVIVAIANKEKHVPFRNSKLTYLLQPCLGGDAKTLMFVNIAPTREFAGESLCSLRFAAKVNACEINPRRQGGGK